MDIEEAFNTLQRNVNAPDDVVAEARDRRNLFINAFETLADVERGRASGSLARGSHINPIRDVDTYIEFDDAAHPDWGQPGDSAAAALDYTRDKVNELLGARPTAATTSACGSRAGEITQSSASSTTRTTPRLSPSMLCPSFRRVTARP